MAYKYIDTKFKQLSLWTIYIGSSNNKEKDTCLVVMHLYIRELTSQFKQ